ncbi:MAG TPA: hypothetical protein VMW70_16185 [Burkholderiales bacterium]|nr:hypothetical protein [Burkholderiales bacterium]
MQIESGASKRPGALSVWAIPLIAGLLPAIAAVSALLLSVQSGLIVPCNPFFDGCVSISRAARHDLPNLVFRAFVLPGATLQAITWILCARWLGSLGKITGKSLTPTILAPLGVLAGSFFVLYGSFLGSEGEIYQWLRRYGINFYFGLTFLCMLLTSAQVFRLAQGGWLRVPWRLHRALGATCLMLLAFGVINLIVKALLGDQALADRLENSMEWLAGLLFTLFFAMLSWLWWHTRFRLYPGTET